MKLTRLCSRAPVAALLPARVGQYSLDPVLLIVMEFAARGTLKALILVAQEEQTPLPFDQTMIILVGTATGMEYLHAADPSPIIHRDIKSENILLTEKLEPRIADVSFDQSERQTVRENERERKRAPRN